MARCCEKRKLAAQREFMYGSSTDPGSKSSLHRTSALSLHPGPPRSTKNTSTRTLSPSVVHVLATQDGGVAMHRTLLCN